MEVNGYKIKPNANLRGANLREADLSGANLYEADLREADLHQAYLQEANLRGANLYEANLRWADLCEANLRGADLRGADLREADLCGANLQEADLGEADLGGAELPNYKICPEQGSFIAYKKITSGVVKIEIPSDAKRTSSLVGRKCRAEFVRVIEYTFGYDKYSGSIFYQPNAIVYPDKYNDDIRIECTHGIHFFMTKEEAEKW